MITFETTNRGFMLGRFKDRYGKPCTIQESSLATEACIWLGVEGEGEGRMHLTQGMAEELIPLLRNFTKTGSIVI